MNKLQLKFLSYCVLIGVTFIVNACGDDDDAGPSPDIVGSFVYSEGSYRECGAGPGNDDWDGDHNGCEDGSCITLIFKSDGTYETIDYWVGPPSSEVQSSGTFSQSGEKLSMDCQNGDCDGVISEEYHHVKVEGNTIILNGERRYDDGFCETIIDAIWIKQ